MRAYRSFRYSHYYHIDKCTGWTCSVSLIWLYIMYLESLVFFLMLCHIVLTLLQLLGQLSLVYWLRFVMLRQLWQVTHGNSSRKWGVLWAWFYVPWWSAVQHKRWEWSQFGEPWGCQVIDRLAPVVPWLPLWWAYWCLSHRLCHIQTILVKKYCILVLNSTVNSA